MSKLNNQQRIEIYNKRKVGYSLRTLSLEYGIHASRIKYLVKLLDRHGLEVLRQSHNRTYSVELKQEIINKVLLERKSISSIAIEYGLPNEGLLSNWIKSYKDNNYVIVELPKGRKSTMIQEHEQNAKDYTKMSDSEKIKYLEKRNQYLEAENDYLKKLDAVVQKRISQQQKKNQK